MEYILYVATSVLIIGQLMTSSLNTPQYLEPVWWMLFHLTALPVQLYGGKYFWAFIRCTAIAITIILVGYCVLTIPIMDFEKFSTFDKSSNPWFVGGVYTFMQNLSVAAWFFVGIEALPLASEETISVTLLMQACVPPYIRNVVAEA
jgi:ethanolamine permease